ncbi:MULTISPECIES: TfuA-like protein [unclassified Caballeronia]|uniref:TfuA-like protein n=1 Tax=unclassified Caballeronia TaxID=2646786 RepID=UPI00285E552E|nr:MULTISPECIES: TfuA-like protein [unclassified Caballeronia]MDR5822801.1 TfuA-like protein [Caballeronia sp. LZ043]MDR5880854.1 TfuA-like protein [Caballeronia sp. LZ032]
MLLQRRECPVVFGGPSLRLARDMHADRFDYRPPARRGDLHRLLAENPGRRGCALLTDGVFGESMAVSPSECIDLLQAGWMLFGASSMGALRAADCSQVGMVGIGDIFFAYRTGYYRSDADVAVLYQADTQNEISMSLAHADHLVRELALRYPINDIGRRFLLRALREVPWYDRSPALAADIIARCFGEPALHSEVLSLWRDPRHNPKVRDATNACNLLSRYFLRK